MSDITTGGIVAGGHIPHTGHFVASCVGSIWWAADQLARHGPRWELVPPTVLALASLLGALRSWSDGRQARRHAEELHRQKLLARAVTNHRPPRGS